MRRPAKHVYEEWYMHNSWQTSAADGREEDDELEK